MFCPNCGTKLEENSKFCSSCGEKISELTNGKLRDEEIDSILPPKKKNFKKIAVTGMIIVAFIAGVFSIKELFAGVSGKSNAYVYLSDGNYELSMDFSKDKDIEMSSSKSESVTLNMVSFSPDGKYVYYFTKCDNYTGTGTLCKAEYAKLKENSNKNDKYIEVIASNVKMGFGFFDDGTLIYKNGDDNLYYYNEKEIVQIARFVSNYYIDGEERIIYETKNEEAADSYTLYGVSLDDMDNRVKLAANYNFIYVPKKFDHIFYTKKVDDKNTALYVAEFKGESKKLGNYATILNTSSDGSIYFMAEDGTEINLYDYVTDDYAAEDSGVTEPDKEDYRIPEYHYSMISDTDLTEDDYSELYTSCTKKLYWYGENSWWQYSMEDALDRDWGEDTDAIHDATQNFIERFGDLADEDGYILVTDEVKEELKKINAAGSDESEWLWLCLNKEQVGETYDYEAYDAACDAYDAAKERIEIREKLQSAENAYKTNTLYRYANGNLETISGQVMSAYGCGDFIIFNTPELVYEKINIDDVTVVSDVRKAFYINYKVQNYVVPVNDTKVYQISENAAEILSDSNKNTPWFYIVGTNVYMDNGMELFKAKIGKDFIEGFEVISDDAFVCNTDENAIYYSSGSYTNNGITYQDLYSYKDGKSVKLAQDITTNIVELYDDGIILTRGEYGNYGYELTMFSADGTENIIGDRVTQYVRVDKSNLLYISDNDLYLYNGKEKTKVRYDVDCLWSLNKMESLIL